MKRHLQPKNYMYRYVRYALYHYFGSAVPMMYKLTIIVYHHYDAALTYALSQTTSHFSIDTATAGMRRVSTQGHCFDS